MDQKGTSSKDKDWCIDIYSETLQDWMLTGDYTLRQSPYGSYIHIVGSQEEKKEYIRRARRQKIRYRIYEKKWDRSSDYRNVFFTMNPPPYRCRYCHRPLNKQNVFVDHIIPVHKVKRASLARDLLYLQNIKNVNDPKNLVAACSRCNRLKADKMGIWLLKAKLGKYESYWKILHFLKILTIITIIVVIGYGGYWVWQYFQL